MQIEEVAFERFLLCSVALFCLFHRQRVREEAVLTVGKSEGFEVRLRFEFWLWLLKLCGLGHMS